MAMNWQKKGIDSSKVRELAKRFELDLISASILTRRGWDSPEEICFFLEEDLRFMHNPFEFIDMEEVVERINSAVEEGESILVFGDRDADGIIATVLMVGVVEELGGKISWRLPMDDEPYGLTLAAVDEFANEGGTLIITVDCGISCIAEVEHASTLGIDTIVIDHHNPPDILPDAYGVINPKVVESGYPFSGLSGCGVVSKVGWALRFSRTDFYNQPITLLNVIPKNDSFLLEAVRLVNLVEVDRICETLVPGMVRLDQTRLEEFFSSHIMVYDLHTQVGYLKRIFGASAEIGVVDLAQEIAKHMPRLAGKSLLSIREQSRVARYACKPQGELDQLISLFVSYVHRREAERLSLSVAEMDLLAMGTLADLMPIVNENRIMVKQGLKLLNRWERPALEQIRRLQKINGSQISAKQVVWQLTPLLNATGRMGRPDKSVNMLLSTDLEEVESLAEEVYRLNQERKRLCEEGWKRLYPVAREYFQESGSRIVLVQDRKLKRGITGIIATRLAKHFKAPAVVIALMEDRASGSIRSAEGFNAKEFLTGLSDYLIGYGGHDFAAGFSIELEMVAQFVKEVRRRTESAESPVQEEVCYQIDAELTGENMVPELIHVVDRFEPYGEGFPPLLFLLRKVKIIEIEVIGNDRVKHLRLLVDTGKHKWPGVFWRAAEKVPGEFTRGDVVDIVFTLARESYMGRTNPRLTVMEVERCRE